MGSVVDVADRADDGSVLGQRGDASHHCFDPDCLPDVPMPGVVALGRRRPCTLVRDVRHERRHAFIYSSKISCFHCALEKKELVLHQIDHLIQVERFREEAAAWGHIQQALSFEANQGFSHGRRTHPQAVGQLRYHDLLAWSEAAIDQLGLEGLIDRRMVGS